MKRSVILVAALIAITAPAAFATIHQIEIGDFYFSPLKTKVSFGDTVRWTLAFGIHTTTSNNSNPANTKLWNSGTMSTVGQTYDVVFTAADGPGPFPYECLFHPQAMVDTIFLDTCYATFDVNNDGMALTVGDGVELLRILGGELPYPDDLWDLDLNGDCVIDDGDVEKFFCYFVQGLPCIWPYPVATCCFPTTTVGACCLGDSCSIRSADNCAAMGGTYYGDGTTCTGIIPCCCIGPRGNVDNDPMDVVDVGDLSMFVDFVFTGDPVLTPCLDELNVDGLGGADISDLTVLVDFLFFGGPLPTCAP